ncbi:hypothetical protein AB0O31_14185 [Kitasatospora cineracea]|uniref:hypothetical protein n=1 Tax=Kitasatospora cineracea TaxID=88074 RepID=UPI00342149F2
MGCPTHHDTDGQLRASAGWLLEHVGLHPGDAVSASVRCSTNRSPTLVADTGATATDFTEALRWLIERVVEGTAITLHPEPTRIGRWESLSG